MKRTPTLKIKDVKINVTTTSRGKFALSGTSVDDKYRYHVWVRLPDLSIGDDEVVHRNTLGSSSQQHRAIKQSSTLGKSIVSSLLWHADYLSLKEDAVKRRAEYEKRQDEKLAKRNETIKKKGAAQEGLIFVAKTLRKYGGEDAGMAELRDIASKALAKLGL